MAYAILRTGSKQYRVKPGDVIDVDRLPVEEGSSVELSDVLAVSRNGEMVTGNPVVPEASVVAQVHSHVRDKKIIVFKYKRKVRYRRKKGHRQSYTRLAITAIVVDGEEFGIEEALVQEAVVDVQPPVDVVAEPDVEAVAVEELELEISSEAPGEAEAEGEFEDETAATIEETEADVVEEAPAEVELESVAETAATIEETEADVVEEAPAEVELEPVAEPAEEDSGASEGELEGEPRARRRRGVSEDPTTEAGDGGDT